MYQGQSQGVAEGYQKFTGIDTFTLLAVNPTAAEIEAIAGYKPKQEPDYSLVEDQYNGTVRPLVIYAKGTASNAVVQYRINIGAKAPNTMSGNFQVCTSTGEVVWAKATGETEVKPQFADHRPLVVGEADLISFVQKCVNFSTKSGEDFLSQMISLKQDAASIFKGDLSGIQKLISYMQENKFTIVSLLTVRKTDEGKTYQQIATKPGNFSKLIFHGNANDWVKAQLLKNTQKDEKLVKEFYTIDFQVFDENACLNSVPQNPSGSTGGWGVK